MWLYTNNCSAGAYEQHQDSHAAGRPLRSHWPDPQSLAMFIPGCRISPLGERARGILAKEWDRGTHPRFAILCPVPVQFGFKGHQNLDMPMLRGTPLYCCPIDLAHTRAGSLDLNCGEMPRNPPSHHPGGPAIAGIQGVFLTGGLFVGVLVCVCVCTCLDMLCAWGFVCLVFWCMSCLSVCCYSTYQAHKQLWLVHLIADWAPPRRPPKGDRQVRAPVRPGTCTSQIRPRQRKNETT